MEKEHEKATESTKKKLDEALKDSTKEAQEKAADGEQKNDEPKTSSSHLRHFRLKTRDFEVEYDSC